MKGPGKEKFPECIKYLLIAAGYETSMSLKQMNEIKIVEIEKFLTENKQIIQKMKCCYSAYYKQLDTFAFLPGHRSTILAIPDKLNSKKPVNIRSNDELKKVLIDGLMACSGKAGCKFPEGTISEFNIQDFQRVNEDDLVCKCRFTCPFCTKSFSLKFTTCWTTSNATKHLKLHIAEQNRETA